MELNRLSPEHICSLLSHFNNFSAKIHSPKKIYIVDFYDWLEAVYLLRMKKQYVKGLFSDTRIKYYTQLRFSAHEFIYHSRTDISKSIEYFMINQEILHNLLDGYLKFTQDLEIVQKKLLKHYTQSNGSHIPYLVVPFSFGLNRLVGYHVQFKLCKAEESPDNTIACTKGILKDNCSRLEQKIKLCKDLQLATYSCVADDDTYKVLRSNLPKDWRLYTGEVDSDGKPVEMITSKNDQSKLSCIFDVYTQYKYVGYAQLEDNKKVFLLNYPFLQKEMLLGNAVFYTTDIEDLRVYVETCSEQQVT